MYQNKGFINMNKSTDDKTFIESDGDGKVFLQANTTLYNKTNDAAEGYRRLALKGNNLVEMCSIWMDRITLPEALPIQRHMPLKRLNDTKSKDQSQRKSAMDFPSNNNWTAREELSCSQN
ncbi:27615_t:CDS:2 [Gigaspora margarita]|uniref:27615_t:CDS:1 n=1 Tax=Gigaspora margarita TaxID=4874 RepID=A0ABM8W3D6_GIGMA|nr:27615_t:CDS:2 [Gigaspora margarita]